MQYADREETSEELTLTQIDRIPEAERFRTYYAEAKLMIGLIHPYAVRDVNIGYHARNRSNRRDSEGRKDHDGDDWSLESMMRKITSIEMFCLLFILAM